VTKLETRRGLMAHRLVVCDKCRPSPTFRRVPFEGIFLAKP